MKQQLVHGAFCMLRANNSAFRGTHFDRQTVQQLLLDVQQNCCEAKVFSGPAETLTTALLVYAAARHAWMCITYPPE